MLFRFVYVVCSIVIAGVGFIRVCVVLLSVISVCCCFSLTFFFHCLLFFLPFILSFVSSCLMFFLFIVVKLTPFAVLHPPSIFAFLLCCMFLRCVVSFVWSFFACVSSICWCVFLSCFFGLCCLLSLSLFGIIWVMRIVCFLFLF